MYRHLGVEADLTQLEGGQKGYKGHKRVFDGATNLLKASVAPDDMTENQLKKVTILKKVRVQKDEHQRDMANEESDSKAKMNRRDHQKRKVRLGITEDKRKGNGKGGKNVMNNLKDKE